MAARGKKGFYWSSKAWYGASQDMHEVSFGLYNAEGGTEGECAMRWHELVPGSLAVRLEIFEDAFHLLGEFIDVFVTLGEWSGCNISEETFVELLRDHDFEDLTPYESPGDQSSSK